MAAGLSRCTGTPSRCCCRPLACPPCRSAGKNRLQDRKVARPQGRKISSWRAGQRRLAPPDQQRQHGVLGLAYLVSPAHGRDGCNNGLLLRAVRFRESNVSAAPKHPPIPLAPRAPFALAPSRPRALAPLRSQTVPAIWRTLARSERCACRPPAQPSVSGVHARFWACRGPVRGPRACWAATCVPRMRLLLVVAGIYRSPAAPDSSRV